MPKRMAGMVLKITVTTALFILLFRPQTYGLSATLFGGVSPKTLVNELHAIPWSHLAPWLLFAALVKLGGMLAGVVRWRILLAGQGVMLPFVTLTQSWFVGRALGVFLPSTLGLDGYRLYDSATRTGEGIKCAAVIAVEKLTGFISLTLLVFLTFPLGFHLVAINKSILAVILSGLGAGVLFFLFLLFNPHVLPRILARFPVPRRARLGVNRIGTALTAYHGQRRRLAGAIGCALLVHLGTCFMFFGTMMAIRAENTELRDILFASPIMIYGTLIGPSIGGEGIRELVFATLLGAKSGVAPAVLFAHLGWWVGEVLPALLGAVIFVLRGRRDTASSSGANPSEESGSYRGSFINGVVAGLGAGLLAGTLTGVLEAWWVIRLQRGMVDYSAYWWGPVAYGLCFAGLGGMGGMAICFLMALLKKHLSSAAVFSVVLGSVSGIAALMVLTVWIRLRDALGHTATCMDMIWLGMAAFLIAVSGWGITLCLTRRLRITRGRAVGGILILVVGIIGGGYLFGRCMETPRKAPAFTPQANATGPNTRPNIILIAVDTLRADYLSLYDPVASAPIPSLESFARDAVLFQHGIAQAPWTKPAFASIFTGQYPSVHRADTELASLADGVTTFPQLLSDAGYYTSGFANNAHLSACFGFDQGFAEYTELKPRRMFYAGDSAARLALYEGLRRLPTILARNRLNRANSAEAYQPAEAVTRTALTWLDRPNRPAAPFFLFLHYMDTHDPYMDHEHPGIGYAHVRLGQPNPDRYLDLLRNAYNSEITYLDKWLGVLFDRLKQQGLYEKTLVVFVADHGEEFYDHQGWWHGRTLYDEMIHVPLLIKYPGNQYHGLQVPELARQIDLAPTLLEVAGVKRTSDMPGHSLANPMEIPLKNEAYSENNFEDCQLQSLRTDTAKLIRCNPDNPRGNPPLALFDLVHDPKEQKNLAGREMPLEKAYQHRLDAHAMAMTGKGTVSKQAGPLPPEMKEQLEAVGYLGGQ